MNNQFVIYPHCYFSLRQDNLFIYCPKSHKHIILNSLSKTGVKHISGSAAFIYSSGDLFEEFVDKCIEAGVGYSIPFDTIPFIMRRYDFQAIASLQKTQKALGYADGLKISNYVRKINIHIPSEKNFFSELECEQLDYPNDNRIQYRLDCLPLHSFSCLEAIYISGDFSEPITNVILNNFQDKEIILRIATCEKKTIINVASYCRKNAIRASIYLLPSYNGNLEHLADYTDVLTICPIIYKPQDVSRYLNVPYSVLFTPIIKNKEYSHDLISEMLISDEDILNIPNSLEELYRKERINPNYFGYISINCTGKVYSASSYVGNINDNWMQSYTNWIYNNNNPWFITRDRKLECKGCHFHALCPPISIYEHLFLIPRMCKEIFLNK